LQLILKYHKPHPQTHKKGINNINTQKNTKNTMFHGLSMVFSCFFPHMFLHFRAMQVAAGLTPGSAHLRRPALGAFTRQRRAAPGAVHRGAGGEGGEG
jgi:hypothetical protein